MAKGNQITEEQMTQGLQKIGGFGSFKQDATPKKDSPFGFLDNSKTTKSELPQTETPVIEQGTSIEKTIEFKTSQTESEPAKIIESQKIIPMERGVKEETGVVPVSESSQITIQNQMSKLGEIPVQAKRIKNRHTNPEPSAVTNNNYDLVTVFMTAEDRDRAKQIAAELQRKRTVKTERITANSIFRVAIKVILEEMKLGDSVTINSEEDLYRAIKGRIKK